MSTRRKRLSRTILGPPDRGLIVIICALVLFGIMAVFSAGAPEGADVYGDMLYFWKRHLIFAGLGTIAMIAAYVIDYRFWRKHAAVIAVFVIFLLIATFIPGFGQTKLGSSRWLDLGGLSFQPSELCKFSVILLVATAIIEAKKITEPRMLKYLGLILLMIIILLKQPNLSSAVILGVTTAAMLLAGGTSFLMVGGIAALGGLVGLWKFMQPYQMTRIKGWLDPWADPQGAGYNLIQSLYAIGSGGLLGVGYGNSRQKLFWLPFSQTDFIFAVIAEELGFIGCLVLIGLFVSLFITGVRIAGRCYDSFGKLLAFGITFSITIQAFINIAVSVGVLPVTGITLPLISYGGTSVVLTLFMLGILLNISRKRGRVK